MKKSEKGLSTPDTTEKSARVASPTRAGKKQQNSKKSASQKKVTVKVKGDAGRTQSTDDMEPIVVKHQTVIPDGLPKKYFSK
ncbi:MAG: hypothetical protein AB1752_11045, partial [Candidatus Zixiibacteriota bacterium]